MVEYPRKKGLHMTLLERLGGREAITRGIVHTFRILSRRPRPSRHEEAAGEELDAYLRGLGHAKISDGTMLWIK